MKEELSSIRFNVLKTPLILDRLIVITVFFLFFTCVMGGVMILEYLIPDFLATDYRWILGMPSFFGLLWLERRYDKIVRSRIIGEGFVSLDGISVLDNEFNFSEIKMLWVNYGLNTLSMNEERYESFLFKNFETLQLRIISGEGERLNFHIDNCPQHLGKLVVSDYIEHLKKEASFF